jgi:RNA-binding protein
MTPKKELSARANTLKPIMQIGKQGVNAKVLAEIKTHLKKRKLIKVKVLPTCIDAVKEKSSLTASKAKKAFYQDIAEKTDSEIISSVGFTVVLWKG